MRPSELAQKLADIQKYEDDICMKLGRLCSAF